MIWTCTFCDTHSSRLSAMNAGGSILTQDRLRRFVELDYYFQDSLQFQQLGIFRQRRPKLDCSLAFRVIFYSYPWRSIWSVWRYYKAFDRFAFCKIDLLHDWYFFTSVFQQSTLGKPLLSRFNRTAPECFRFQHVEFKLTEVRWLRATTVCI